MNVFKRAVISVRRMAGKSALLFLIVLILGFLASGAISVLQAIENTEINLLRQIPPIATINVDMAANLGHVERYDVWPEIERLSPALFTAIGELPYVRLFDYTVYGFFFSDELIFSTDTNFSSRVDWLEEEIARQNLGMGSYRIEFNESELFGVKGVTYANVLDVETDLIDLVSGRVFTQDEMDHGEPVVLLPLALAQENGLELGDTFELEARVYDQIDVTGTFVGGWELGASVLASEIIELEVIGLFTPTVVLNDDATMVDVQNYIDLNRRMYVPLEIAKREGLLRLEHVNMYHPDDSGYHDQFHYRDIIFVLYDALDLEQFHEAATELLPDFWMIEDLRTEFTHISRSMSTMQNTANWLMIGAIFGFLMVLGLFMLLFLYDRRMEIGIYLALGESKKRIVTQILIEMISVATIAIVIALFVGNMAADHITHETLRRDLVDNPAVFPNQDMNVGSFNSMGFSIQMTGEEMLQAYAVSLDMSTMVTFFATAIGMVALSTALPVIYLTKFNPKDQLMKSSIG
ncbi:MAG: ABC transporter permease [Defluviitaleaceae bacterium]|nr:ABC transporter permease [Defluviitaleaceae bacterium]